MRIRLRGEVEKLKKRVAALAALVEERFRMAIRALEVNDPWMAEQVIAGDLVIDREEVDVEEECLKILALHQPVADDLRFIVAMLKMNNDLERIGDLAVNIAQHARSIASSDNRVAVPFEYFTMAQKAQDMLKKSLDSLVNVDVNLAYQVCAADDEVDKMKYAMQASFAEEIRRNQNNIESSINLFLISRHLERIADHATNIAEDVIYMIVGRIHRHGRRGAEDSV
jgi:phosphate transport system protein